MVVWSLLSLLFVVVTLVVAIESAMHFNGTPIDGPFQLYNALRRIAAGYHAGVDFQFFHGLGVPYLYYGLFRIFGGGLRGSELARNIVSPIVFTLVLVAFFRAFLNTWRRTLCATTIALALAFVIPFSAVSFALVFAVNGMLGVRAALPLLLPVALYRCRTPMTRAFAAGIVLGLALFFGTEQGLAALLAYALVSTLAIIRRSTRRAQAVEAVATVAIAVSTLVLALMLVAGWTGMRGALRYNFSLVPGDQYWFFGSPPNVFAPSWQALFKMATAMWQVEFALLLGLAACIAYLVRFWRTPDEVIGRRNFALATLPLYGVLSLASLLGVFIPVYSQPCWRTIGLVAVIEWFSLADRNSARNETGDWLGVPRLASVAALALTVMSFLTVSLVRTALVRSLPHVLREHVFGHSPIESGGIWPVTLAEGQALIDSRRDAQGAPPLLWSTYAGWIEARNGLFNPSFDYMIHALGPENRRAYTERFAETKPRLAQTVLPTFTRYEPWLENANWPFYDELLRWYDVTAFTPWSVYWERRSTPNPDPVPIGEMKVPAGMTAVRLPPIPDQLASKLTLLEVEIDYSIDNPFAWLPIIGKSPRYFVAIGGAATHLPVSLDPFVQRMRFPLVMRAGQQPTLSFLTESLLPGAAFTPRALRLYVRPINARTSAWVADLALLLER
jgi:hypothetical protein